MARLNAEEAALEVNQRKKRPSTELTGDERKEGNKRRPRAEPAAGKTTCQEHEEEPEGKKCSRTEPAAEGTCREEKKMETARKRYSEGYADYILSWNTDWEIPELPIGDDEMTEERRSRRLDSMKYWAELRARTKALQEFVRAQVQDRGYAEMPEEAGEPPKVYYHDDGEEMLYLGFGIYDE
jgi:hypothetical protein